MFRTLLTILLWSTLPHNARAEHRVALLIDQTDTPASSRELQQLAEHLRIYGFRSTTFKHLPGSKLKSALESFTSTTPTRGTVLVYFRGSVLPGNYKGKSDNFLAGTDAKPNDRRSVGSTGFGLESLLNRLSTRGGSSTNLVILDTPQNLAKPEFEIPADCELFLAHLNKVQPGTEKNFLQVLRSQAQWSTESLAAETKITGTGSKVVSSPGKFVEGKQAGDEWVNAQGMVFCWCPPGKYLSGSPEEESGRYPDEAQKQVEIKRGFWMGKYELTLRENRRNRPRNTLAHQKNDPLTMINHDDAKRMTTKTITEQEQKAGRLPTGWQYSLPTEQQWEYAARAGTTTRYSFGNDVRLLPQYANFGDKSYYDTQNVFSNSAERVLNDGAVAPVTVGSYQPNPWGLYDVHGNVAEWCINTAIRGGSWVSTPANCRSAHRDSFSSRNEQTFIGYRLVIQPIPQDN